MIKESQLGRNYCCWKIKDDQIKPPEFLNAGNGFYIINGDVMVERSLFKDVQLGSIAFDDGFLMGIVLDRDEDYVKLRVVDSPKLWENKPAEVAKQPWYRKILQYFTRNRNGMR